MGKPLRMCKVKWLLVFSLLFLMIPGYQVGSATNINTEGKFMVEDSGSAGTTDTKSVVLPPPGYNYYAPPKSAVKKRQATVSLNLSAANIRLRSKTLISGAFSDRHPNKIVTLVIRKGKAKKSAIINVRLDNNSRYSYAFKPASRGKYYVIAKFTGDACHYACKSRQRIIAVK